MATHGIVPCVRKRKFLVFQNKHNYVCISQRTIALPAISSFQSLSPEDMCGILRSETNNGPHHTLKWVSIDPSTASRLGDLGYVDTKGCWRVVLNIFDSSLAEKLGIKAFAKPTSLDKYILQHNVTPFDDPIIELRPRGGYRLVASDGSTRWETAQGNQTNSQSEQ